MLDNLDIADMSASQLQNHLFLPEIQLHLAVVVAAVAVVVVVVHSVEEE